MWDIKNVEAKNTTEYILMAPGKAVISTTGGAGGHHWAIMVDNIVYDISKFCSFKMLVRTKKL